MNKLLAAAVAVAIAGTDVTPWTRTKKKRGKSAACHKKKKLRKIARASKQRNRR